MFTAALGPAALLMMRVACTAWVHEGLLPGRLDDAWNLTLQRESAEAETADAELAKERTRASAELAAVVLAALELGLTSVFYSLCSR